MSTRTFYLPFVPKDAGIAWVEANGIDPYEVPVEQTVTVTESNIMFQSFVFDRVDGKKKLRAIDGQCARADRTVPLVADPSEFDLEPVGAGK